MPFLSPDNLKNQIFKIEKNTWRYYHFTHLHHKWKSYDIWFLRYGVWQTEFFAILDRFFLPFYPRWTQNIKILKNEKNTWRYYHFTNVHHKWQSYDAWFQRYGVKRKELFVILDQFLPFYSPNNPKNQNFEKMKKQPGDNIILHRCTINDNQVMYGS